MPSGRVPPFTDGSGDRVDIDVIDQRRRERIMISLKSVHLTMDSTSPVHSKIYKADKRRNVTQACLMIHDHSHAAVVRCLHL